MEKSKPIPITREWYNFPTMDLDDKPVNRTKIPISSDSDSISESDNEQCRIPILKQQRKIMTTQYIDPTRIYNDRMSRGIYTRRILNNENKKLYCRKVCINIFKMLYFIISLVFLFSPTVWIRDHIYDFCDHRLMTIILVIITISLILIVVSIWKPQSIIPPILLLFVEFVKFLICWRSSMLSKMNDNSKCDPYDRMERNGYIALSIMCFLDIVMLLLTIGLKKLNHKTQQHFP